MLAGSLVVLLVLIGAVVVLVLGIVYLVSRIRLAEMAFKKELVEKGLSAEEIEQILRAPRSAAVPFSSGAKPDAKPEWANLTDQQLLAELAFTLQTSGFSGAGLKTILEALQPVDRETKEAVAASANKMIDHVVYHEGEVSEKSEEPIVQALLVLCKQPPSPPTVPSMPAAVAEVSSLLRKDAITT